LSHLEIQQDPQGRLEIGSWNPDENRARVQEKQTEIESLNQILKSDKREYTIKQEYDKKLADMKAQMECEYRIKLNNKLNEKDEDITSIKWDAMIKLHKKDEEIHFNG